MELDVPEVDEEAGVADSLRFRFPTRRVTGGVFLRLDWRTTQSLCSRRQRMQEGTLEPSPSVLP